MSIAEDQIVEGASRIFVPALMFQAVAIGGAYATGREIVEFGAVFGTLGWAAGLAMMVVGAVSSYLVYETARRYRLFDYSAMTRHLIGRSSWLFDVIYIPFAIAIFAVLSSATGNILRDTLGLEYWVGVAAIIFVSAVVTLQGTDVIEKFNGIGTILLMAGYVVFSILVITTHWDNIMRVFSEADQSLRPDAGIGDALLVGAIYVGLGFVVYPSTLMTVRHLRSQRDAAAAGILTGGLFVVPWFLTFLALMGFYPSAAVFDAPVPWLVMLQEHPSFIILIYGVLVAWTLVATAVGILQSIIIRVNQTLIETRESTLTFGQKGAITLVSLLVGALLAQIGIIHLIAVGYLIGAIALLVVFGLPLVARSGKYLLPGSGRTGEIAP